MVKQATILYIEDDEASRILVQRALTYAGFKILIATRALDGIDLAKKHEPDLILTDINLPDLSGREIIVRLRADARLATVPIVALTAQNHAFERDKAFAAGATGYITKPVDVEKLVTMIESYLRGRRETIDGPALQSAQQAYNRELVERLEANVRDLEASNRVLRRLDQIKEDFIQLTAHELRTPLTTVYGYSRLVQTSTAIQRIMAEDQDVNACLKGLMDSIDRLNRVVNEIITISRVASGRIDLKLGPTDLHEIIDRVISGYLPVIQARKLSLKYDPRNWPGPFYADGALLELAFNNLFSNAIKYTPDGGAIALEARLLDDDLIRVSVQDSGIGINQADQQHIFDRFYTAGDTQLHSTSKTAFRGGGLGLGLAISRGIVEAHGGRIWVESECCDENRLPGSTFFVEFPLNMSAPGHTRRSFL
jgi:signal transduction histidine kinase